MASKKPAPIPIPAPEVKLIDKIYNGIKNSSSEPLRLSRLGASSIGDACLRKIWLSWRGYDKSDFDGRMIRLFETGHLQEQRIINDLIRAGCEVWSVDENNNQYAWTDETGHFVVKVDGIIKGVEGAEDKPHILEIKTHNTKSFAELEKKGVEASKPAHYFQMQAGMLFSGIDRAFYVALNKDDERYYVRRIKPDLKIQSEIMLRIKVLLEADLRPAGVSEDIEGFPCRWCDLNQVCYDYKPPLKNCRSCEFSHPLEEGKWGCAYHKKELSLPQQLKACESYETKGGICNTTL